MEKRNWQQAERHPEALFWFSDVSLHLIAIARVICDAIRRWPAPPDITHVRSLHIKQPEHKRRRKTELLILAHVHENKLLEISFTIFKTTIQIKYIIIFLG